MQENNYKIPNKIVWDYSGSRDLDDSSLIAESKNNSLILLHCALMFNRNIFNIVNVNISQICEFMKLPKRIQSYKKIKLGIKVFQDNGYLNGEILDYDNIKPTDTITINYEPFDKNKDGQDEGYFFITDKELNLLTSKYDKLNELNLYCYISSRIFLNRKKQNYEMRGKYEVCFPSYEEIKTHLYMGNSTVNNTMKNLYKDNLIYFENAGMYKITNDLGKQEIRQCRNTITLTKQDDYKTQVRKSIKYFKSESKYDFIKSKSRR